MHRACCCARHRNSYGDSGDARTGIPGVRRPRAAGIIRFLCGARKRAWILLPRGENAEAALSISNAKKQRFHVLEVLSDGRYKVIAISGHSFEALRQLLGLPQDAEVTTGELLRRAYTETVLKDHGTVVRKENVGELFPSGEAFHRTTFEVKEPILRDGLLATLRMVHAGRTKDQDWTTQRPNRECLLAVDVKGLVEAGIPVVLCSNDVVLMPDVPPHFVKWVP